MRKAIFIMVMILVLLLSNNVLACDEEQTNIYVTQIMFGDSAQSKLSNDNVKALLAALYLCCEQCDEQGQEKIDYLKEQGMSYVPKLSKIDIKERDLMMCSHNTWEYNYPAEKNIQKKRKKVLQKTVNDVFDFGIGDSLFNRKNSQCNSFAAILYYSHILSDYLADGQSGKYIKVGIKEVPAYSGKACRTTSGGKPSFTMKQKRSTKSSIKYNNLDTQGRAQTAFGNIGPDTIKTVTPRNKSEQKKIKPSGYQYDKYPKVINTKPAYLYNRCHLIAHQLGGREIEENFVTGTRYMNEAMETYETKVANYVRKTDNHVLYRVTPSFEGGNKIVSGIKLEAYSVEDNGKLQFNVFFYNVQPGIKIDYSTGDSSLVDKTIDEEEMLPFAVQSASEANPDLILEMGKHLNVLFNDQKDSATYSEMTNEIKEIASEARTFDASGEESAKDYVTLKECEYKYYEVLKSYVPVLLSREEFFKATFQ